MKSSTIYATIKAILGENFKEVHWEKLKHIDRYYIDQEERKYILICKIFKDTEDLMKNWELYQDEDIALKLQNVKYLNDDIRWDMYYLMIYKGEKDIDSLTRYEIERDRFCCKKLVIDGRSSISLNKGLKHKLPMLKIVSNSNDEVEIANDEHFFNIIQTKTGIDAKKVLNEL